MFGISGEHLLILVIVLILFGPKKLPDLGHSIGRTMKNFKDSLNGNTSEPVQTKKEQITHTTSENKQEEVEKEVEEKKA